MSAHAPMRVLVIDDDADTRANLADILELDDMPVASAGSAAEALARTDWDQFGAILLDRKLPDGSAEELLPQLRLLAPHAAILIVTGYSDLQGAIAALRQGAADYILKPISPEALRASLLRVADRRRLTLAKEGSEAAFRTLVETAPCLIVILSLDDRIAYFNHFAEQLTGFKIDAVLGSDFFQTLLPAETRQSLVERFRCKLAEFECQVLCQDGSRRAVLWNVNRLPDFEGQPALLCIGQDITSLKQAQERTLQAERLAAIGQMMTGLAHESGNALARSQACLEMLALEIQDRPDALDLVGRVQKAQNHLQQLYEEVRSYAAPLRLERELRTVDSVWRQAWTNLAVARTGRDAVLREQCAGVDLYCSLDPFRLEQVFRNILENALGACRDPVQVTIRAEGVTLDHRPAVRLSIRDNGPGLNPEQRRRIFEPFYTTKTKGTGLGMAIATRIIEAHAGNLMVGDPAGPGAELIITLPREQP